MSTPIPTPEQIAGVLRGERNSHTEQAILPNAYFDDYLGALVIEAFQDVATILRQHATLCATFPGRQKQYEGERDAVIQQIATELYHAIYDPL